MEDKKFFNNADGFFGTEGFQELNLDDLDNVAGGRKNRDIEMDSYSNACLKMNKIIDGCPHDVIVSRYENAFKKARIQWIKAVKSAPEDSADILFTDYFDPQKVYEEIRADYFLNG